MKVEKEREVRAYGGNQVEGWIKNKSEEKEIGKKNWKQNEARGVSKSKGKWREEESRGTQEMEGMKTKKVMEVKKGGQERKLRKERKEGSQ